jgi:hypothetical protein
MTTSGLGLRQRLRHIVRVAAPVSALLFGALLCLYYGREGFMPIDQSIVYDGAYRLLCGQVPMRDFLTPTGIAAMLFQAAFFRLFGVNWFAYCLHAAVFNGLFAALAYAFLRQFRLPRPFAWLFAMLSAVVMYVPSGTPLMEQDAFLFILLACVLTLAGARAAGGAPWLWAGAGLCLLVALLCKQNPALFGFPLVLWILWTGTRTRRRVGLLWLLVGLAGGTAAITLTAVSLGVDWTWARLLLWELPGQIGHERLALLRIADPDQNWERSTFDKIRWAGLPLVVATTQALAWLWLASQLAWIFATPARSAVWRITRALLAPLAVLAVLALYLLLNDQGAWATHLPTAVRWLVPALTLLLFGWPGSLAAVLVGLALLGRERCGQLLRDLRGETAVVGAMQGLMFACATFFSLTLNEECNGVPYYFVAMGLAFEAIRRVHRRHALHASPSGWHQRSLLPVAAALVLALAVADGARFHLEVNVTRTVNDKQVAASRTTTPGGDVAPALRFMRFHVADVHQQMVGPMDAGDYQRVIDFLHAHDGNFFLFGDSAILYSLTGRPSVSPALWLHSGLTYPGAGTPGHATFEAWLLRRVDEERCRYVVLEGKGTLFGLTLTDLPSLRQLVERRERSRFALGAFTAIELAPPPDTRVASRR